MLDDGARARTDVGRVEDLAQVLDRSAAAPSPPSQARARGQSRSKVKAAPRTTETWSRTNGPASVERRMPTPSRSTRCGSANDIGRGPGRRTVNATMTLRGGQGAAASSSDVARPLAELEHAVVGRDRPRGGDRGRSRPGDARVRGPRRAHAGRDGVRARARVARAPGRDRALGGRRRAARGGRRASAALDEIREMLTTLTPPEPGTAESLEQTLRRASRTVAAPRDLVRRGRPHVGPGDGARRRVVRDPRVGGQRRQARGDGPRERAGPPREGAVEVSVEDHGRGSRRGRRPPATSASG